MADVVLIPPTEPIHYEIPEWLSENEKYFLPPVCNKMMHNDGQMKCFYVGGPNQRKDYHIEIGEELFYMLKGDMCLKVIEQGVHKDIIIREGEIFLLPGKIAHSPQRNADTVGLVIERERALNELDGLRYFVEKEGKLTLEVLYEEWFHVVELGVQLAPVIKRFFASEQYKTGKPIPGTITENPPITLDSTTKLQAPFSLEDWLSRHKVEIDEKGVINVFEGEHQFEVMVFGKGTHSRSCEHAEIFIWQLHGTSVITVKDKEYKMKVDSSLLVPIGQRFSLTQPENSRSLVCYQDPTKANL